MEYQYEDGIIKIGIGDSYPPGHKGQHTSCNRNWYKLNDGEWIPCGSVSRARIHQWLLESKTAKEFIEKLD
jgi:hypothetical protein